MPASLAATRACVLTVPANDVCRKQLCEGLLPRLRRRLPRGCRRSVGPERLEALCRVPPRRRVAGEARLLEAECFFAIPTKARGASTAHNCLASAQTHVEGQPDKSVWRTGQHEFNSETSDGTWGFSQVRLCAPHGVERVFVFLVASSRLHSSRETRL